MNILVLNWQDIRNPLGGGAEVHLHEIFRRIAARGHTVTLFTSGFPGAAEEETIDGIRILRKGTRSFFNFTLFREYHRRFQHIPFDVVVDDINKIPFYTPLFVRRPLLGMFLHLFGSTIFREVFAPAALYVYGAERLALSVYRSIPIAVISESTRRELMDHGFAESNLINVGIAVNHDDFRTLGLAKNPQPTIGYLGRIKKYKSIDQLIRAFGRVRVEIPEATLFIVGEGDGRRSLEDLVHRLGLEGAVTFTGYLPEDEKVKLVNRMHVVVNTSAKEGWGLTVTEANACGVPVIASNVPGLRDAVKDGETGLLYEYGNVEELARKLIQLLKDEPLRQRLGKNAQEYASTFRWDLCAERMLGALERVRSGAFGSRGS